ncbi:11279_t:CDS:2 [Ambispora leptoticha]|uniref:11279_t:CDS:1 n=1 Tax=Ambispora leptoticha TaxID=144679 RepID=A0A9N9CI97_9GLOM|nr:11279_t:CDS:2 [Ambispora leptoticha]
MSSSIPTTPQIKVYGQTHLYLTTPIYFQLVVLKDSAFAWVASHGNEVLQNLAVAMPPVSYGGRDSSLVPPATTLLTRNVNELSKQLGQKLARKFNKQFLVSLNLPPITDQGLIAFAEKKLVAFIKEIFEPSSTSS